MVSLQRCLELNFFSDAFELKSSLRDNLTVPPHFTGDCTEVTLRELALIDAYWQSESFQEYCKSKPTNKQKKNSVRGLWRSLETTERKANEKSVPSDLQSSFTSLQYGRGTFG